MSPFGASQQRFPDVRAAHAALAAAQHALVTGEVATAETGFDDVIAFRSPLLTPIALVGRASCERLRGAPFRATETLQEAARQLATMQDAAFADYTRPLLLEERVRVDIALGLLDRIPERLDELRALPGADGPMARYSLAVLQIEVHSARSEPSRALRVADRALDDPDLLASSPAARSHLEALAAIAEHDLDPDPAERRALGERLLAIAADPATPGTLRFPVQLAAVRTLQAAGEIAAGRAAAESLLGMEATRDPQRLVEALAAGARDIRASDDAAWIHTAQTRLDAAFGALCLRLASRPLRDGGIGWLACRNRRHALDTLLRLDAAAFDGDLAVTTAAGHLETMLAVGTLSRGLGARSPTIDAFRRELLDPGEGALLFSFDEQAAHVIAIDAGFAHHAFFDVSADDLADRHALQAALEQPTDVSPAAVAVLAQRAHRLGARLLPPPIRERVDRWRSVLLVGDARTAGVFQLVPCDDTWLCLARPVRHVPSLAIAAYLAQLEAPPATRDLAILAAPRLPAALGLAPLPITDRLDAALDELAPRRKIARRYGDAASVDALREPAVLGARVCCFVTHGCRDFERERYAGIRLAAQDPRRSEVYAETFEGVAMGELVIAAVCRATSGPLRVGDDGAEHLGGAFLTAGARAVLAAPGDLPVDATVELVTDLLRHLDRGDSAATALQRARRAVASRPATSHPWFFAGLLLTGHDCAPWAER